MRRVLVIGYGSPLRRDDGVGSRAAEMLGEGPLPDGVEVIAVHQLTLELSEPLSRVDRAIFLDCRQGERPGEVLAGPVPSAADDTGVSSHHLTPGALLRTAHILYGSAPEALLVTVTAADLGVGEGLSPALDAVLPLLVDQVRELCVLPRNTPGCEPRTSGSGEP